MYQHQNTKLVSIGGILLALSIATLFFASFMPGIEMTLYALSSIFPAVMIIETNSKGGIIFYIASGLLALVLIPNKVAVIPYLLFFGLYSIAKYYIEKIRKQPVEICLKIIFFNVSFGVGIFFFKEMLISNFQLPKYPGTLLIIGAQLMFLLYDYILTLLIIFYKNRLQERG